jgi:hypothetical protein
VFRQVCNQDFVTVAQTTTLERKLTQLFQNIISNPFTVEGSPSAQHAKRASCLPHRILHPLTSSAFPQKQDNPDPAGGQNNNRKTDRAPDHYLD